MDRPTIEGCPPHGGAWPKANKISLLLIFSMLRRGPIVRNPAKDLPVKAEDDARTGAAEPHRVLDQRFQDRLQVERRAADDLEDLTGGSLLLQRLGQVTVARLH